jgi:hypothetical protein
VIITPWDPSLLFSASQLLWERGDIVPGTISDTCLRPTDQVAWIVRQYNDPEGLRTVQR